MIARYLLLMCIMSLGACASPKYNYVAPSINVSEPPLGEVRTEFVGDILLRQGVYSEHDAIEILEEFKVGMLGTYTYKTGFYSKVGSDKDTEFYEPENGPDGGRVIRGALADPYQSMQVYIGKNRICAVTTLGGKVCKNNISFTRLKRPALRSNSFQQSLIYSGRIGDKINIGYREFSNSVARPAFNNDVEYDLKNSNIIGYKGARLEIIEATNQQITYRVLSNFR